MAWLMRMLFHSSDGDPPMHFRLRFRPSGLLVTAVVMLLSSPTDFVALVTDLYLNKEIRQTLPVCTRLNSKFKKSKVSKMARGGARPGAGRKSGLSKETIARRAAQHEMVQQIEATIPEAFLGDGYALVAAIYKDTRLPLTMRFAAAQSAMPYERPRLSQIDMNSIACCCARAASGHAAAARPSAALNSTSLSSTAYDLSASTSPSP